MSFINPNGACSYQEFLKYESKRMYPQSLVVDDLVMLMAAAKRAGTAYKLAAHAPVRVRAIDRQPEGLHVVQFGLLDSDLKDVGSFDTEVNPDAYMHSFTPQLTISKQPVETAYFKGYADPVDLELAELTDSLRLSISR